MSLSRDGPDADIIWDVYEDVAETKVRLRFFQFLEKTLHSFFFARFRALTLVLFFPGYCGMSEF